MRSIIEKVKDLRTTLKCELNNFEVNTGIHFDWLKSVEFQINCYDTNIKKSDFTSNISEKTDNSTDISDESRSYNSNMQFMDESILSDSDIDETEITPNTCGMYHDLSEFASQFHQKWAINTEKQKRSASYAAPPVPFRFSINNINVKSYQMTESDDEDYSDFSDNEYDDELLEIHGKAIPIWASKKFVFEQLKRQENENPNQIFKDLPTKCVLKAIFN